MPTPPDEGSDLVNVLMEASRTFAAVVAASMTEADETITAPQLRVLVVLEGLGSTNLSDLATELGIDTSTASRACEQLVQAGLLSRNRDRADRRQVVLALSARGKSSVERLLARRRELFTHMAVLLEAGERAQLERGLQALGKAARHTMNPPRGNDEQDPAPRR